VSEALERYVLPQTGEVLDLTDAPAVGRALRDVRRLKQQLDEARRILEDALVEESRRVGTKTLHLGSVLAIVYGGEKVEWDVEELWKLRDAGLPEERLTALIKTEVTYKVDAAVARQIAAANPDYRAIIERARLVVPASWRVSVKEGTHE
jgi:hypothetical protein